jgi:hypothetical protein
VRGTGEGNELDVSIDGNIINLKEALQNAIFHMGMALSPASDFDITLIADAAGVLMQGHRNPIPALEVTIGSKVLYTSHQQNPAYLFDITGFHFFRRYGAWR